MTGGAGKEAVAAGDCVGACGFVYEVGLSGSGVRGGGGDGGGDDGGGGAGDVWGAGEKQETKVSPGGPDLSGPYSPPA